MQTSPPFQRVASKLAQPTQHTEQQKEQLPSPNIPQHFSPEPEEDKGPQIGFAAELQKRLLARQDMLKSTPKDTQNSGSTHDSSIQTTGPKKHIPSETNNIKMNNASSEF